MPNLRILLPALLLGLCLPVKAQQVYRSIDAEGNVVFSDTPSAGSKTVDIQAPNLADSVKVPPPPAAPAASATPAAATKPTPQPSAAPLTEGELVPVPETRNKRKKRRYRHRDYEYGR